MDYKFIYFDLDDTLLDHRGAEKAALKDLHEHFEMSSQVGLEDLIETYHRINSGLWIRYGKGDVDRDMLQRLRFENTLDELGLDRAKYNEVGRFYMNAYRDHWNWVTGAFEAFEQISNKFETGILTNGFAETQKEKIKRFSLSDVARHLVISEETGYLKPQPEIFEHATSLTSCEPEEILYVGDSYTSDVIGGSAFGWKVAWYTNGAEVTSEKKGDAHFTFSDFEILTDMLQG